MLKSNIEETFLELKKKHLILKSTIPENFDPE